MASVCAWPMVGKCGYHRHFRLAKTLSMPLYDTDYATVLCPMAAGLRITSGAELARDGCRRHAAPDCQGGGWRARRASGPWAGRGRQAMDGRAALHARHAAGSGSVPGQQGLWTNFGHGHQGFTLGPTTGTLLAAAMAKTGAPIDAAFCPARWL